MDTIPDQYYCLRRRRAHLRRPLYHKTRPCNRSQRLFILSESDIREWKIPSSFLKPILPSPRYIKTSIIDALPNGAPNLSPRLYLLDCDVPEKDIKAHWPRFYEYLKQGKRQKVNESYLSSRREPWYSQEKRPPSLFSAHIWDVRATASTLSDFCGTAQRRLPIMFI